MAAPEILIERKREFEKLMDWFHDNGARQIDRFKVKGGQTMNGNGEIALYRFAGRTLIVKTHADGHGWNFYVPVTDDNTGEGTRLALQGLLDSQP